MNTNTTTTTNKKKVQDPFEDKILYLVVNTILILFSITILYPMIYIISSSFSAPGAVSTGKVLLWPVDPGLYGYRAVFSHKLILGAYRNTFFYTFAGTAINVVITMICAYPLSRRDFPFRNLFMFLFTFTMFFGGGLIPTYILMVKLRLINTVWAMLIPGALSVYNMILVRTFLMSSIPGELLEASQIDGCSDARYFFEILLPLSKPVIAVITLFYAVGHWNSYFSALIYLDNQKLYPLQIILRNILIASQLSLNEIQDVELMKAQQGMEDLMKYALIVVSSAPVIALYPFIQKYFIKGVMIGAIKG